MKKASSRRGNNPRGTVFPSVPFEDDSDNHSRSGGLRHARLSDVLRQELDALLRDDVADPALEAVSVPWVELSPDYRLAKVHVVTPRVTPAAEIERALARAAPFLRHHLADVVELKFVPALRFTVATGVAVTSGSGGSGGDECA